MAAFVPPLTEGEVAEALPFLSVDAALKSGGQGAVFAVTWDGQKAALKVYSMRNLATRIEREVASLRALQCHHIVRLLGSGQVEMRGETCMWTLTDYVEGSDVAQVVAQGPMSEDHVRHVLSSVVCAIDCMWAKGIVHRDIKPDNIMQRAADDYVVIDLGIAKHLDLETLTRYGNWIGTPGFMSPEQMLARPGLTLRSDLFSLGIVAYYAATGQHPFHFDQNLVPTHYPPPPGSVVSLSASFDATVMRMLEKSPTARPSSGEAVARLLREG